MHFDDKNCHGMGFFQPREEQLTPLTSACRPRRPARDPEPEPDQAPTREPLPFDAAGFGQFLEQSGRKLQELQEALEPLAMQGDPEAIKGYLNIHKALSDLYFRTFAGGK